MKTPRLLLGLITLGLLAFSARADETADRADLMKAEQAFGEALVKNDPAMLEKVLSADWTLVISDGSLMRRDAIFKSLKSGTLKFSSYTLGKMDIRIFGDAAVIIGVSDSKGEWEGEKFEGRDRFTDVFIRRDGKWLCVSTHSSDLAGE